MEPYLNWLASSLGESIAVLIFLFIGYLIGGAIGVYFASSVLLYGTMTLPTGGGGGGLGPQSEAALLFGFGIPVLLTIPGLLIRYGLAKRDLAVLLSAGISFALWFIAAHAFYSHPQVNQYSAVLGALTFSICYSGFSHPVSRVRRRRAASQASEVANQRMFTVNFKEGDPSGWVNEQQVLEWYANGRIDASTWVYPSDTCQWQRLKTARNLAPDEVSGASAPQASMARCPANLESSAATKGEIPPPRASVPTHPSLKSDTLTAKLKIMASSELVALLETGAFRSEAEEQVKAELARRGISFK